MLFLVLVADFFVLVFNRFLFFHFSLVSVFSIFLVLVFINGIVIFSFLVIFVFVNENHTVGRGFESQPPRCRVQSWASC